MAEKGLVHIYTGEGKGKTTAAIGLAVRASGAEKKVLIVQFLKGMDTSELEPLRKLGITVCRGETQKFIPFMTQDELQDCKKIQESTFEKAIENINGFDMVILDEALGAISADMISMSAVIRLISDKPEATELILTGREAPEELIRLADYVSDIRCVKHPYNKGICARKGIEF
jgi:cob(I)alamin adenosyltransferase